MAENVRNSSRPKRQQHIRELVQRNRIQSQEDLMALLQAEGVVTTQSTLSRDLRDIGAVKRSDGYHIVEIDPSVRRDFEALRRVMRGSVTGIERGGAMVVIRSRSGRAPTIASELKQVELPSILGAVADIDTVMIACSSSGQARELERQLSRLLRR